MTIDADLFRSIFAGLPAGVAVVTAMGSDGIPRGLTSTAVCPVSADPPMLLACVGKSSRTLPAIMHSRGFTVNFLAAESRELSRHFAGLGPDKFAGVPWRPSRMANGAPILAEGVVSHTECVVADAIEVGDHWIILGAICHGAVRDAVPLLYCWREYAPMPSDRKAMSGIGPIAREQ
jgi:flavin reductase (DIM6/NTAB) family NADH-FMN oxidoreductase RutF